MTVTAEMLRDTLLPLGS